MLEVLGQQGTIRNGEVVELTGLTTYQASQVLARLRNDGRIEVGSTHGLGRSVFYVARGLGSGGRSGSFV